MSHTPRTPSPVAGLDLKSLPLGPEEAFVLSRVDGRSSESDIVACTGLATNQVSRALRRLAELGAIRFGDAGAAAGSGPPPTAEAGPQTAVQPPPEPATESPHHSARALPALPYDPAELEEKADLDPERKRQIVETYHRLNHLTHYQLLEVEPDADKKEIKQAYYEAVALFHPDRYFGKNLGSFKLKLERVFTRMTEAHDTLTRKRSRAEYDDYLAAQRHTRVLERQISDERSQAEELESVRQHILAQAGRPSYPDLLDTGSASGESRAVHTRIGSESSPTNAAAAQPADPRPPASIRPLQSRHDSEARRKALARKLAARGPSSPPLISSPIPPASEQAQQHAADSLKRRYEARLARERAAQVKRYVAAADEALEQGSTPAAANALRIAVSLAPDDLELAARCESIRSRAAAELAETYRSQAVYEERSLRFDDAARSYARAARGKPSAQLYERAAHCLLEAGTKLRTATEHARQALAIDPDNARVRLTLARTYLASNLRQSAVAELERAAALAPDDKEIQHWLKRVKR